MNLINRILSASRLSNLGGATVSLPAEATADGAGQAREIEIIVKGGYKPSRIEVVEGEHLTLRVVRKESSACSRELVFPTLGMRQELPEGKPVFIHLPALAPGEYEFTCGMNMLKGTLVVRTQG